MLKSKSISKIRIKKIRGNPALTFFNKKPVAVFTLTLLFVALGASIVQATFTLSAANITSDTSLTLTAGGTNQNIILTPSGAGGVGVATTTPSSTLTTIGTSYFSGTSTFGGGFISNVKGSTQCLHVDSGGAITGTGSDCGTGSSTFERVHVSLGAQTIPNNTSTTLNNWQVSTTVGDYDPNGMLDPSTTTQILIPTTGHYIISAHTHWATFSSTTGLIYMQFHTLGSASATAIDNLTRVGITEEISDSGDLLNYLPANLVAGDKVQVIVYQNTGGSATFSTSSEGQTWLSVRRAP